MRGRNNNRERNNPNYYTNNAQNNQNSRNNNRTNGDSNQSQQEQKAQIFSSANKIKSNIDKDISFFTQLIDKDEDFILQKLDEVSEYKQSTQSVNGFKNTSDFIKFLVYLTQISKNLEGERNVDSQRKQQEIDVKIFKFLECTTRQVKGILDQIMSTKIPYDENAQQFMMNLLIIIEFAIFNRCQVNEISYFQQFLNVASDMEFNIKNSVELESFYFDIKENESTKQIEMYQKRQEIQRQAIVIDNKNPQERYLNGLDEYYELFDKETNVIPTHQDCINNKNYFKQLTPINATIPYLSQEEYLQNAFQFLKADSHQGIVQGMFEMINITKTQKRFGFYKFRRFQKYFNFYQNIQIKKISFFDGLNIQLLISPVLENKNTVLRLDLSKRLLGDQLLYLTETNLKKIIPCQVQQLSQSNQVTLALQNYNRMQIKIKVLDQSENQGFLIEDIIAMVQSKNAMLIEPKNYFGHYFNTMSQIKQMIVDKVEIPFIRNIINLEQNINPPSFVKSNTKYYLDFTPFSELQANIEEDPEVVLDENGKEIKQGYQQTLLDDWSKIPTLNKLTYSQQNAIKNILTKEISLIQGPPGTGKTYIGAMAIKNIIANYDEWNGRGFPILMCCKTNHALDQFLQHILKFEKNIVRIGSRTKEEEIKKYQLNTLRNKFQFSYKSLPQLLNVSKRLNESLVNLSNSVHKSTNIPEIISFYPKQVIRSMLIQTIEQLKIFIQQIDTNEILDNPAQQTAILKWWWQMECDVDEIMTLIVYPQIQKHIPEHKQDYAKKQIKNYLIEQNKYLAQIKKQAYEYKLQLNQQNLQFFWNNEEANQGQQQNDMQEQFLSIWEKVKVEGQQKVQQKEKSIIQDEDAQYDYAEDRENFNLDDSDEEKEENDDYDEQFTKNERMMNNLYKKVQRKIINSKEDYLYFTYFEFINSDIVQTYKLLIEGHSRGQFTILNLSNYEQHKHSLDAKTQNLLDFKLSQLYILHIQFRLYGVYQYYSSNDKYFLKDMSQVNQFFKLCQMYEKEKADANVQIMKDSKIVAMTLSGASKYSQVLKYLKYPIAIIEEAGEVLEQLSIPILQPFVKQLILIGDHQQLKPSPYTYLLEKKYNLNISLFERLVSNQLDFVCLNHQMRMRPEFSDYVRLIYKQDNQYQDHEKVLNYPKLQGFPSNPLFFLHENDEQSFASQTTKKNIGEAKLAYKFAKYIISIKQYKASQITILSLYLGQSQLIRQLVYEDESTKNVRVSTVDNYQGEENEIIILSLVRSEKLGYVKTSNRINVAISRAKQGFIVLANKNLIFNLQRPTKTLWDEIHHKALANNHISNFQFEIKCPQHSSSLKFSSGTENQFGTYGGCKKMCTKQNLKCKHKCNKQCHYQDCDLHLCDVPIKVQLPECNHESSILCHQNNSINLFEVQCQEQIYTTLPCSHSGFIKCYQFNHHTSTILFEYQEENFNCQEECGKQMICGHACKQICGNHQYCNPQNCTVVESIRLPCDHVQDNVKCGEEAKCMQKCQQILECGHKCTRDYCWEYHRCDKLSTRKLECGHEVNAKCSDINITCNQQFKKCLPCGHFRMVDCSLRKENDEDYQCKQLVKIKQYNGSVKQMKCYENQNNGEKY